MANKNLTINLLRTLITICEAGSHTRAARLVGRTQPTISLQIKRLDQLLGVWLLTQSGHKTALSDDGQQLAVFARQILRLNDEAVSLFAAETVDSALRIGLPLEFSTVYLQSAILKLAQQHPDTDLKIHCA